ncbi:60S ribosomal protein L23a [Sesamum alatum]|uniref:60S ribosomal protein L23a n=1 Tax=Sesamum alatum TaxID=300844 RepID=A0AAE1YAI0_9LAMI|nr:60S ribosomal protein L23a [Sesamum alatum]
MITSAVDINSGICLRRHTASFPSGFSSRKLLPLTSALYPKDKDALLSFRPFESRILCRALVHPPATNREADARTELLKNTDVLTSSSNVITIPDQGRKERNPRRLNKSVAETDKPDLLPVIRYPLSTESAIKAMLESNTLVFVVDKRAGKKNIKDAFKNMLKTTAKKVNTLITPDGTKKAYIVLGPDCKALDVAKKIKIL